MGRGGRSTPWHTLQEEAAFERGGRRRFAESGAGGRRGAEVLFPRPTESLRGKESGALGAAGKGEGR